MRTWQVFTTPTGECAAMGLDETTAREAIAKNSWNGKCTWKWVRQVEVDFLPLHPGHERLAKWFARTEIVDCEM